MCVGQPAEAAACGRDQERAIVVVVRRIVRMAIENMASIILNLDFVMGMSMPRGFRLMVGHDFDHRQRVVRRVARDGEHGKAKSQRDRQQ